MRYTRYNYKKKRNNNTGRFILSFLLMSGFVVIVGVVLANVIIYFLPINNAAPNNKTQQTINDNASNINVDSEINDETVSEEAQATQVNSTDESISNINTAFAIIQCGYFSKNENATIVLNQINNQYGAFIYNDNDKFKVLAGVFNLSDADEIIGNLKASGVDSVKVAVNLDGGNKIQNQIAAICDGYIKILNTALGSDVKGVLTDDFKAWTSKLENIEDGENKEILDQLKNHVNELPKEVARDSVSQEMEFLYKILLNFNK